MFERKNVGALSPGASAQSADGDMWPRDETPLLIQSLVFHAWIPIRVRAVSAVKQLHRGELPVCDLWLSSRFQLTQFGPPCATLYESVYWRRAMMTSSLGSASVGTPSSVLCPTRAFAPTGRTSVVIDVEPLAMPSLTAVALITADPALCAVMTPFDGSTETTAAFDEDQRTLSLFTTAPCVSALPLLTKSCVWKPTGRMSLRVE